MSKQKLDMMFGAFDGGSDNNEEDEDQAVLESSPDNKKGGDKKKKKKSKSKKRKPEDSVTDLQSKVQGAADDTKRFKADEEVKQDKDDMMEDEDDKLRKEGELIEQVINTGGSAHIGYDENDYVVEV